MPIFFNFDVISRQFEEPLRTLSQSLIAALDQLARWLNARLQSAGAMDNATRQFPRLQFSGEALVAWVDASQHHALRPASATVGGMFASGAEHFVRGLARTTEAVDEEFILPRAFRAVRRLLDAVASSFERFNVPTPEMFDPGRSRAADLFGLAALGINATLDSADQILASIPQQVWSLIQPGTPRAPGAPGVAAPAGLELPELLDKGVRGLGTGILLLMQLPEVLGILARAGSEIFRSHLLARLEGIERKVFEFREKVVNILTRDLPALIVNAFDVLLTLWTVLEPAFIGAMQFGIAAVNHLITSFQTFARQLYDFMNPWITLVNRVLAILDAIMNTDLMPVIVPLMGLPAWILSRLGVMPRLTLGDVLDASGNAVRVVLRETLLGWLGLAERLVSTAEDFDPGTVTSEVLKRIRLLQQLVTALFAAPRPYPAETDTRGLSSLRPLPNLYNLLIGAQLPAYRARLSRLAVDVAASARGILSEASSLLGGLSGAMDRAGARVLAGPPLRRARSISSEADRLSDILYGPQIAELSSTSSSNPLAAAFTQWVTSGGFSVVGAIIPTYVREMLDWQDERARAGDDPTILLTPTSPHIVAARARLARVRMRHLVVRVERPPTDDGLPEVVARRIQAEVQTAYARGTRLLQEIQMAQARLRHGD